MGLAERDKLKLARYFRIKVAEIRGMDWSENEQKEINHRTEKFLRTADRLEAEVNEDG